MKSKLTKLISLAMALTLVASLAACGTNNEEETTTGADVTTEAVAGETSAEETVAGETEAESTEVATEIVTDKDGNTQVVTEKPADKPAKPGDKTTKPADKPATPGAPSIAKPANAAEGVKLYNDALGKISSTKATINRKLTKGYLVELKKNLDDLGDVSGEFAKGSGPINSKLSALNAGDVASFSVSENGANYVMTFNLKTKSGSAPSLKHGMGGYMYFLDVNEIMGVVSSIGNTVSGGKIKITMQPDKSSIELTGGKLVVTVNKTTGKMSSANLHFTENINGKCKTNLTGPIAVSAQLTGVGDVKYTLG